MITTAHEFNFKTIWAETCVQYSLHLIQLDVHTFVEAVRDVWVLHSRRNVVKTNGANAHDRGITSATVSVQTRRPRTDVLKMCRTRVFKTPCGQDELCGSSDRAAAIRRENNAG